MNRREFITLIGGAAGPSLSGAKRKCRPRCEPVDLALMTHSGQRVAAFAAMHGPGLLYSFP
jgi:hypothetical protein